MHILCTICSDLVNAAENIHATKCGHLFHHRCLSQWIARSKSCPQCRNKVTDRCMFRIYPTISNENSVDDAATLQSRLDDALLQLRQQKASSKDKEDKLVAASANLKKNEELLKTFEKKLVSRDSAVSALKEQLEYVKIQNKETQRLKEENEGLKKNMRTLNGLQKVLNATSEEVEEMLQGYTDVKTVATFATALKRALCESESKKNELRERLQAAKQSYNTEKMTVQNLQARIVQLEDKLASAERRYEDMCKREAEDPLDTLKRIAKGIREQNLFKQQVNPPCEAMNNKRKAEQDLVIPEICNFDRYREERKTQEQLNAKIRPGFTPATKLPRLNDAILISESNTSFDSMVKSIENADSPYLNLKQSSLALTALQQRPAQMVPENKLKPSEFALLNSARNAVSKKGNENLQPTVQKNPNSIFHIKPLIRLDLPSENSKPKESVHDISYDGLGGHSKLDPFPVYKPPVKSCVPKLTAKHKLKRPNPTGSQDISKMLGKLKDSQ